ncbi:MAG: hypothetical protein JXD18_03960, partial [Anaerolineae bacterium]|nr:hypothetical protein [Anaerolineae bacterium]
HTAILPVSGPLTYTWEATGQPGQTRVISEPVDTAVFTWTMPGARAVTVTVTGPCGTPVSDTHRATVTSGDHLVHLPLVSRNAP